MSLKILSPKIRRIKGENWIPHVVGLISLSASRGRHSAFKAGHFNCCVRQEIMTARKSERRGTTANVDDGGARLFHDASTVPECRSNFTLRYFKLPGLFPPETFPFSYAGGRNVASGNEILPKLVGAADQVNLTSLETAVVSIVYLKVHADRPQKGTILVVSGVSLLLFRCTVEITLSHPSGACGHSLARLNVSSVVSTIALEAHRRNPWSLTVVAINSIVAEVSIPSQ